MGLEHTTQGRSLGRKPRLRNNGQTNSAIEAVADGTRNDHRGSHKSSAQFAEYNWNFPKGRVQSKLNMNTFIAQQNRIRTVSCSYIRNQTGLVNRFRSRSIPTTLTAGSVAIGNLNCCRILQLCIKAGPL